MMLNPLREAHLPCLSEERRNIEFNPKRHASWLFFGVAAYFVLPK